MKQQSLVVVLQLILIVTIGAACAPTPTPVPPTAAPTQVPPTAAPTMAPTAVPTAAPSPTPAAPPQFSFAKGAEWTFQGAVKWDLKGKVQQKNLTWKMQVVDKIERRDGIVGYVMRGHPLDLAFYEDGKKPSDYMYLAKGNRVYQVTLVSDEPVNRVKNANDPLTDLLIDELLVLDLPLAPNKKFGPAQFVSGSNEMNVWVVTGSKAAALSGIKGVTATSGTEYALTLKTNPDHQTVYYVPGVGITHFTYAHNGTVSEVDVKLTEFKAGG